MANEGLSHKMYTYFDNTLIKVKEMNNNIENNIPNIQDHKNIIKELEESIKIGFELLDIIELLKEVNKEQYKMFKYILKVYEEGDDDN